MAGVFSSRVAVWINGVRIPEITDWGYSTVRDMSIPVPAMSDDINIQGYAGNQRLVLLSLTVPNRYIPLVSLNYRNVPLSEGIEIVVVRGQQNAQVEFEGYTMVFSECRLKTDADSFTGVGTVGTTTIEWWGNPPETS